MTQLHLTRFASLIIHTFDWESLAVKKGLQLITNLEEYSGISERVASPVEFGQLRLWNPPRLGQYTMDTVNEEWYLALALLRSQIDTMFQMLIGLDADTCKYEEMAASPSMDHLRMRLRRISAMTQTIQ